MRERVISVDNFDFINFLEVDIKKSPDHHVTASIKGMVKEGSGDNYIQKHKDGNTTNIYAIDENGNKEKIMHGIIQDIFVEYKNQSEILNIKLISQTILLDIKKRKRSYQDEQMTFEDVCKVMSSEGNGSYIIPNNSGKNIKSMMMQYNETDWEFSKRLSSRLNLPIIPNYLISSPYISLGIPNSKKHHTLNSNEYNVIQDFSSNSSLSYKVLCRNIYNLCDLITFNGVDLYVHSINTIFKGSELIHEYLLKPEEGFFKNKFFNYDLIGAEIDGSVTDIKNNKVKVQLSIDSRQCDDKWFDYDTVYSSPDGTGWYFMPEKGDSIRLQVPSEHEEYSHVISAVHIEENATRSNPDIKSIITKYNKSVVFEPEAIHWSNGTGSTISLIDKQGIVIKTSEDFNLSAAGDININGDGKIFIQGDNNVIIDQAGNQIKIDENIDLTAGHIRFR